MIPGDLTTTQVAQVGSGVVVAGTPGTGTIDATDSPLAFQNITVTGFISCQTCTAPNGAEASGIANSPVNVYGGALQLVTDNVFSAAGQYTGVVSARHNIKTGHLIPSNVLAEADIKIDDAVPNNGQFRFSIWSHATAPDGTTCLTGTAIGSLWQTTAGSVEPNCGGATLIN